jgi:hypothetical protein
MRTNYERIIIFKKIYTMLKTSLFSLFLFFSLTLHSQSKLKSAKENINTTKTKTSSKTSFRKSTPGFPSRMHAANDPSVFRFFAEITYKMTLGVLYFTFIESPWELTSKHSKSVLTPYPYSADHLGEFAYEPSRKDKTFRLQISSEYLSNQNRIKGTYSKIDIQFAKRFGLTADCVSLSENIPILSHTDEYAHSTFLVNYYRIRTEKMSLWYGMGLRYAMNGIHKAGFAYSLGTRIFIKKPLSLESHLTGSKINGSSINQFGNKVKYHFKQSYFSLGWNLWTLGSEKIGTFATGLGIYF